MVDEFEQVAGKLRSTKVSSTETQLELYALYKQATCGPMPPTERAPSLLDFRGRAKWNAWLSLKQMRPDDARAVYIARAKQILAQADDSAGDSEVDRDNGDGGGGSGGVFSKPQDAGEYDH